MTDPPVSAQGSVFITPADCRFVVISDIDDTVVRTGIGNTLVMLWRLFVEDARSRLAFPGVAALYQALHRGVSWNESNPLLYVSRAPWGTYEVLEEFFHLHGIPVGPILFLREWGISWRSPLPRTAKDHKQELIGNMLALYDDLPFVLIGDSGQQDPEIYRHIVEEHPGRVIAVFIRDVSRNSRRARDIEQLAIAVSKAGSTLLLAADSVAMAEQAVRLGLVSCETQTAVGGERAVEGEATPPSPTETIGASTPSKTAEAVVGGEIAAKMPDGAGDAGLNVVVEDQKRTVHPIQPGQTR